MKKKHHHELCRYTRYLADEMGLRDWTINVWIGETKEDDPSILAHPLGEKDPVHNVVGTCEVVYGQRWAIITIPDGEEKRSPEETRLTIVHELLHCHLDHLYTFTRNFIGNEAETPAVQNMAYAVARQQLELCIDAISRAWMQKLPVIEWPS